MDKIEVLLQEYNNLWNEKNIHKQSIRKFHYYLSYLTAIMSLALAFYGLSFKGFVAGDSTMSEVAKVIYLFFYPFYSNRSFYFNISGKRHVS